MYYMGLGNLGNQPILIGGLRIAFIDLRFTLIWRSNASSLVKLASMIQQLTKLI